MKLPTEYCDDILGFESQPEWAPRRNPQVYSLVYPPIGFFPFYGNGCGDYHGYYWPIGRENGPPLVAFSSHYVGSLIPEQTDVLSLYRCQVARSVKSIESCRDFRELVVRAGQIPVEPSMRDVPHGDFETLLTLDPESAFFLCACGDASATKNDLDAAEDFYRRAIEQLPEYVAAHFGLALILRRKRCTEEAVVHLRAVLIGPLAFYGGSFWAETSLPGEFRNDWARKCLMWLQRANVPELLKSDPFIRARQELTYQTGLAHNRDFDVLQKLVDEYASAGRFDEAARIWQLIGDRAAHETTPFRERLGLSAARFGQKLAELFELAGNRLRAELVMDMVQKMEKNDSFRL